MIRPKTSDYFFTRAVRHTFCCDVSKKKFTVKVYRKGGYYYGIY